MQILGFGQNESEFCEQRAGREAGKMRQNVAISFVISWLHFSIRPLLSAIHCFFLPIRFNRIARR
jgi:hypothetical protein